jgi:hypothetical protein
LKGFGGANPNPITNLQKKLYCLAMKSCVLFEYRGWGTRT